jgi:hypothetical protein
MVSAGSFQIMAATLKETISDFFTVRSWKSKWRKGTMVGKGPKGETEGVEGLTIRLLEASRPPVRSVERLAVEILKREGRTSFTDLVEHIARELYFDELRHGASVLDIGLYGPDLCVPNVASELKLGDGILWKIETPKEQGDGILPDLS